MEAFPVITSAPIGEETLPTVNARDLHTFLEVGRDFSNWIKTRIDDYGFLENQDFVLIRQNGRTKGRGGDRRSIDYHLTLDMAKELAMVERTEQGRRVRRYFIDCERRLIQQHTAQPAALPGTGPTQSARIREALGFLRAHPQGVRSGALVEHITTTYGVKPTTARRLMATLRKVPGVLLAEQGREAVYRVVEGELVEPVTTPATVPQNLPTLRAEELQHDHIGLDNRNTINSQMDRFFYDLRGAGVKCEGAHMIWAATYNQLITFWTHLDEATLRLGHARHNKTPLYPQL